MFSFLFSRRLILEFKGPLAIGRSFVKANFKESKKLFNRWKPHIIVQTTPFNNNKHCEMTVKTNFNYKTYVNNGKFIENKVALVQITDFTLYSRLVDRGYAVTNSFTPDAHYFITNGENEKFKNFQKSNFSSDFTDDYVKLYVKTSKNILCNHPSTNIIKNVKRTVLPILIFIVIVSIIVFSLPLNIKPLNNKENSFTIFCVNQNGRPITRPTMPKSQFTAKAEEIIRKYLASKAKKEKQATFSIDTTVDEHGEYKFLKMIIDELAHNVYQITILWYKIHNEPLKFESSVPGTTMRKDGRDEIVAVDSHLIFSSDKHPVTRIDFEVDEKPCSVEIKAGDKKHLPFGQQSLHVFEIGALHDVLLRAGIKTKASNIAFIQLMKSMHDRLDYKALCVAAIDNDEVDILVKFVVPGLKTFVDDLIEKYKSYKGINNYQESMNYKKFRVEMQIIRIELTIYIIIFAIDASTSIVRSAERYFNSSISVIISYFHNKLKRKNDASIHGKVSSLWRATDVFAYIECIGSPTTLSHSFGKIFGTKIDQRFLDEIIDNSVYKLTWKDAVKNDTTLKQIIMPVWFGKERKWLSISGKTTVDVLTQQNVYNYIFQDVTEYYSEGILNNYDLLIGLLIGSWLHLHYVDNSFNIHARASLTEEMDGEIPPSSFSTLLRQSDKKILNKYLTDVNLMAYLFTRDGRPIFAITVPRNNNNGFFFFKKKGIESITRVFIQQELGAHSYDKWHGNKLLLIDIMSQTSFEMNIPKQIRFNSENYKIPAELKDKTLVKQKLLNIVSLLYDKSDKETFFDKLAIAFQYGKSSYIARIKTRQFFDYFICNMQLTNGILSIFIFSISTTNKKCQRAADISNSVEIMSPSSRIFSWIFDDAVSPDCIYSSQPYGQALVHINWTTIQRNVIAFYRKGITKQLKEGKVDIAIQIKFDETRWYFMRGNRTEHGFIGICMQVPNDCVPADVRPLRKLKKIDHLANIVTKLLDVVDVDASNFYRRVKEIKDVE